MLSQLRIRGTLSGVLLLLTTPLSASALMRPALPHCERARLASLDTEDAQGRRSPDYCQTPEAQLPPAIQRLLALIGSLNAAVAAVYELTPQQLFATPFALRIKKDPQGALISFARNESSDRTGRLTRLTMGVYPDWSGEPINAGVYAHELGHVVSLLPKNPALPALYRDFASTQLMLEMMADLAAYRATGQIFSPEPELPKCLRDSFRKLEPDLSYSQPAAFFTYEHRWRLYDRCCASLDRSQAHTPRSKDFCSEHLKHGKTPAARPGAFSAAFYAEHGKQVVDGHQLGLPLNSFLLALERRTGLAMVPRLLAAMRSAAQEPARAFACEIPELKHLLAPLSERRHSAAQVLQNLQAELPPPAQKAFQDLWARHAMDIAAQVAEIDASLGARDQAITAGADAFNSLYSAPEGQAPRAPDPRVQDTRCWVPYEPKIATPSEPGMLDDELPGCSWVCAPAGP
jgi:hypothetical protein